MSRIELIQNDPVASGELARGLFITWTPSSTRASSLAESLGFEAFFFGKKTRHKTIFHSLATYFGKARDNIRLVRTKKPKIVVVTNTQWIIAFLNLILSRKYGFKLVFDSHSSAFDHPFIKYPRFLSLYFARKAFVSIVTNRFHKELLESWGARTIIITDIPFEHELYISERKKLNKKFNLCFVCSFGNDEPYMDVFNSVREADDMVLHVTGNYKNKKIETIAYPNVQFTGFLTTEGYRELINNVDALMVLTARENTMQRGGSEAISVGNPLITSKTQMLQEYFTMGTVFVENNVKSILMGIKEMRRDYARYKHEMELFKVERKVNYRGKIDEFFSLLESA
jgi:hypothetical protein